jgi:hypothetical protein
MSMLELPGRIVDQVLLWVTTHKVMHWDSFQSLWVLVESVILEFPLWPHRYVWVQTETRWGPMAQSSNLHPLFGLTLITTFGFTNLNLIWPCAFNHHCFHYYLVAPTRRLRSRGNLFKNTCGTKTIVIKSMFVIFVTWFYNQNVKRPTPHLSKQFFEQVIRAPLHVVLSMWS